MKNIKKNKYNKDYVQISLNVPVDLLNRFDVIAGFLDVNRSKIIIASMSDVANHFSFDNEKRLYYRYSINRSYRKEHQR